ncbi:MAG TPA: cytochrome C oxidase subunit IV family protein [Vicinamibacterales bacterium]|nr:cytochrome C oxidase subunit IV family protein [Vicinamibacterales bacterium]
MSEHIVPTRVYYTIFTILMICTALTVAVAYVDLGAIWGPLNTVVAIAIAIFKAVLVVLFFMHVKYSSRLTWAVIAGGLFWLLILLTIIGDYLTRAWQPFGSV